LATLREERRAWFRSKLHVGPRPPRVTPLRSVACCAARRCVAAFGRPAACIASRLVQLEAARRPAGASRHSTSERRALRSSPLRRRTGGPATCRASRLVQHRAAHRSTAATPPRSVALGAARRCVAALGRPAACTVCAWFGSKLHGGGRRLASLNLRAWRLAQLAAASRDFCPAVCMASRLVQLKAVRRPTAASRHSTSERCALRSSPLRRGTWPSCYVRSFAPSSAQSCMAAHSRIASLHLGASRVAQLAAASRPLAIPLREERHA